MAFIGCFVLTFCWMAILPLRSLRNPAKNTKAAKEAKVIEASISSCVCVCLWKTLLKTRENNEKETLTRGTILGLELHWPGLLAGPALEELSGPPGRSPRGTSPTAARSFRLV